MAYKVGDRITLTSDVPVTLFNQPDGRVLRKGAHGTVIEILAHARPPLYVVHFDSCGWDVCVSSSQMVHATDQLALLRAQLAARDAALDAVLELASARYDEELQTLLLKHGVHPK
jgi:hypothetical protein